MCARPESRRFAVRCRSGGFDAGENFLVGVNLPTGPGRVEGMQSIPDIRRWLAPIAGALLLVVGLSPVPAAATFPGANGRIAFYRLDNQGLAQL
jgi:hypothetical protein